MSRIPLRKRTVLLLLPLLPAANFRTQYLLPRSTHLKTHPTLGI
jgi:hypothetical protein